MNYAFHHLLTTPLFGITLTLLAYQSGQNLFAKFNNTLFNPVLIAVTLTILVLKFSHVSFQQYMQGAQLFQFFNGIVVASASLIACGTGVFIAKFLALDEVLTRSVAARTVTTPLAILITDTVHGSVALITLFALLNGIVSSMIGFPLLARLGIVNEAVIGVTAGISASAIGTSIAFSKSYRMGSYAALGMILNGILSALFIPMIIKLIS